MFFVWTNIYEDGSCFIWHFSNPHVLTFQMWRWSCMTLHCWQQQSFVLRYKCVGYSEEHPSFIHVDVIDGSSYPPPPPPPPPVYPTPITLPAYWGGQRFRSTRKWHCVGGWVVPNIFQGCSAFVFKVKQSQIKTPWPWRWRQYDPPKHQ